MPGFGGKDNPLFTHVLGLLSKSVQTERQTSPLLAPE